MKRIHFYYGKRPQAKGKQIFLYALSGKTMEEICAKWKKEIIRLCPKNKVLQQEPAISPHFTCWLGDHLKTVITTDTVQLIGCEVPLLSALVGSYEKQLQYFLMLIIGSLAQYWQVQVSTAVLVIMPYAAYRKARHCHLSCMQQAPPEKIQELFQHALEKILADPVRACFQKEIKTMNAEGIVQDGCSWQSLYACGGRLSKKESWTAQVERISRKRACESAKEIAWVCILVLLCRDGGTAKWLRAGKKKAIFRIWQKKQSWQFEVEREIDGEKKECYSNRRLTERNEKR